MHLPPLQLPKKQPLRSRAVCSQIRSRSLDFPGLSLTPLHHGWRGPPGANFFPARPLATIQTGRNRSKIQPCDPWQKGPFFPEAFNHCSNLRSRNHHPKLGSRGSQLVLLPTMPGRCCVPSAANDTDGSLTAAITCGRHCEQNRECAPRPPPPLRRQVLHRRQQAARQLPRPSTGPH